MKKIIVVADSKQAKYYKSEGLKITELLKKVDSADYGIDHDVQERHTGFSNSYGSPTHFYDPHSDPKDLNRDDFSRVILEVLEELCSHEKYVEIIFVAPSKLIGDIREHYPKSLKDLEVREIKKDLTHSSDLEIEKIIFQKK